MQIIPAIDLRAGRCVRLRQGNYEDETVFGEDPAAMARNWVAEGGERLHLVDLDGARTGCPENLASVHAIRSAVTVPCQFGGGVRSRETVAKLLDLGIDRVVIGTRALRQPGWLESVCREFPGRICLGLDAREGKLASDGWTATSETSALDFAEQTNHLPLAAVIYTDIARDGMLTGVHVAAVREMAGRIRSPLIASGGVSTLEDIQALASLSIAGCIIGRALYERKIDLSEAIRAAQPEACEG